MTKAMHKFLIYLSIYFCLACFGLSFSPSSEAGVQFRRGSSLLGIALVIIKFGVTMCNIHGHRQKKTLNFEYDVNIAINK
jgi:hypothetical protein